MLCEPLSWKSVRTFLHEIRNSISFQRRRLKIACGKWLLNWNIKIITQKIQPRDLMEVLYADTENYYVGRM